MEKALNFLLQNWLMVGLEVLIFFGIGLLFAKLIWGRYNQRLYAAIEENMNLASQWQALGGSQRDLFKKLRNRWQEDRDGFDAQLEKFVIQLAARDKKIKSLEESKGQGSGTDSPRFLEAEARVKELEELLEKRDEEISGLNHSLDLRAETDEVRQLRSRVTDLEQDLVNAHDKLHELRRSDDDKQADNIPAELESVRVRELENAVTDLKAKLENAAGASHGGRESIQLAALLKQRGRELKIFQSNSVHVGRVVSPVLSETTGKVSESEELSALKEKVSALQDELDTQVDDHSEALQGLYQQISDLEMELQNKEDEIATLGETDTIGTLLAQSSVTEEAPKDVDAEIIPLASAISSESKEAEFEEILAEKDRVISNLKAELKDALDEMTDVRAGYNETFAGVEVLEARLAEETEAKSALEKGSIDPAELEEAKSEIQKLTEEVECSANELSQLRRKEAGQRTEITDLGNQIEELEAIVEDRNAEVSDAVNELKSQKELIRNLRVKIAQQEGDHEGMVEEHASMKNELREKTSVAEMLTARIAEVELALSNRYTEMNRMGTQLEIATGTLNRSSAHTQEVSKELDDLKWDNGIMKKQIVDLEEELSVAKEEAKKIAGKMEEMSAEVDSRRQKALVLEDRYNLMRAEATEKSDALELATSELESARQQLETVESSSADLAAKIQELEQSNLSLARDLDVLRGSSQASDEKVAAQEQSIAALRTDLDAAETENDQLKSQLAAAERSRETIETNRTHLAEVLEVKTQQLGDFSDRINRLIHGDFQSYGGDGGEDGGSQPSMADFFASEDDQINALGDSIALLEARAVDAEQNFGSCENELVVLREEIIEIKQSHQVELLSRTEEIASLQIDLANVTKQLEEHEAKLQSVQGEMDSKIEELNRIQEELESTQSEKHAALEELNRTQTDLQSAQSEKESTIGNLNRIQEHLESTESEKSTALEDLNRAQEELHSLQNEKDAALEELNRKQEELQSVQEELENGRAAHHQHEHSEESASHLKELVETLRNDLTFKQMTIRELEDQLTYERQREDFDVRDEAEDSSHSVNRVSSAVAPQVEDAENGSLRVFFSETDVNLNGDAIQEIDRAAREVRSAGGRIKISVLGYAGSEGSEAMNESLSARRAEAVRERLLENGVSHSLITVKSAGEDEAFSQSEEAWRARRVEVNLIAEAVAETVN